MSRRTAAILDATNPASPLSVPAHETAVLLVDYQNIHVQHAGPKGMEAVKTAQSLRKWADEHRIPVIIASTDTSQVPPRHAKLHGRAVDILKAFEATPDLGAVHPALTPPPEPASRPVDGEGSSPSEGAPPYHVTRRLGLVSALSSEGLVGEILQERSTRSLIVGGITTSGCVLGTARDGTEKGYIVTVVADACADPTPGLHETMVGHVLPPTAHVVSLKELLSSWTVGR
ncbi:Isochorismatase family protein YecD [Cytospora mali]|uniref:Isochorismatase family protein YecD n=1 Tax=Cytospora mali TaxID=578113 RepID=A0A194VRM4_CYTMA|nr:Isochorismatase family protein YecD [Valsa mali]